MPITALSIQHLSCQRSGQIVVSDVAFDIKVGQVVILKGPNGSGKTTVLRTLAGFIPKVSGEITPILSEARLSRGDDATETLTQAKARSGIVEGWQADHVHYIGHSNAIKPRLTVLENMRFWQRFYQSGHKERSTNSYDPSQNTLQESVQQPLLPSDTAENQIEMALQAFGVLHLAEYRAGQLSQGQMRRLGLARLLAHRRSLWLLDEPSASLDETSTRLLETAISNHQMHGGMAIVASHDHLDIANAQTITLTGMR